MWPRSRRTSATAEAHATDLVTIGTQPYSRHDALEALAARLHALPALVYETHSVALGLTRGLRFGLVQHPQGAPEVYVEGDPAGGLPHSPGTCTARVPSSTRSNG